MREPIVTSHGTRSRRTIATLTWSGLVTAAAMLWHGRSSGSVPSHAAESVAMLLAAYAGFSSIFAWMLFSPNRRSSEQSATLFLTGGITVLPPCIIAFCLMPTDSPLRGWVTVSVFLLTVVAVMTPVPEELFAVPRDRASYLRPVTDAMFADLQLSELPGGHDGIRGFAVRPPSTAAGPAGDAALLASTALPGIDSPAGLWQGESGDPWEDSFRGTGISPTRVGSAGERRPVEESRRRTAPPLAVDPPAARAPHQPKVRDVPSSPETFTLRTPQRAHSDRGPARPGELPPPVIPGQVHPRQRPAAAFGFQTPGSGSATTGLVDIVPEAVAAQAFLAAPPERVPEISYERIRDEFGGEMVEGSVPVRFEAGQKRANVHIPFSPPLPGIPEVECEPVGSDALRLKVPVRQTYGIRIEARRADASGPLDTKISFAAVYTAPDRR